MSYDYFSSIDIQAAAVGANETNFPVALVLTDARFATVENGGHVQNTDASGGASGRLTVPADFVASSNSDGSSPYDFEIVNYDATTGHIEMWIKIPSLSSGTDTIIYLAYGDAAVTTTQEDPAGVWSDNFHAVYHCADNGAGNVALDTYFGSVGDVSSEYAGLPATNAIAGTTSEWASNGDGAGSWIQINFDETVVLNRIVLRDRISGDNWGDGQIEFSDETTQGFSGLPVNADPLSIAISPAKSTDSIKITITSGGAGNNRGFRSIQAYTTAEEGLQDSVGGFHAFKKASGEPNGVVGQVGAGLDFDGSDDYAMVWDMDALAVPVTLEMWVNPDTTTPGGIFDSSPNAGNAIRNHAAGQFEWHNASPQFNLGLASGSWQHLAFVLTHDGTDRAVDWYLDGAHQAQETDVDTSTIADFAYFRWGDINLGAAGRYAGILDEFAISDAERDSDWIATRYTNQDDPGPSSTFWSALSTESGPSPSVSPSISPSASASPSVSPSVSPSASTSPSTSVSPSVSPSASVSASIEP